MALLGVALMLVASCQAKVDVATTVHTDGSGTVVVGVGFDDAAMSRIGNLRKQLRTDDLVAAGWRVDEPTKADDGFTWVKASKDFAEPSQVGPIMDELTGPDGVFRDFQLTRKSSWRSTDFSYAGTVDLTKGPEAFSDPQLAEVLDGDPFGGTLEAIEKEEGKPVAEMVSFTVGVDLPGNSKPAVWTPTLADQQPTSISLESSKKAGLPIVWIAVLGTIAIVAIGLVVVRSRR